MLHGGITILTWRDISQNNLPTMSRRGFPGQYWTVLRYSLVQNQLLLSGVMATEAFSGRDLNSSPCLMNTCVLLKSWVLEEESGHEIAVLALQAKRVSLTAWTLTGLWCDEGTYGTARWGHSCFWAHPKNRPQVTWKGGHLPSLSSSRDRDASD